MAEIYNDNLSHDFSDNNFGFKSISKSPKINDLKGIVLKCKIICPNCKNMMFFLSRKGDLSKSKKKCVFCGSNIDVNKNIMGRIDF